MIELRDNVLAFSFPEVHADAKLAIRFQRTLRIPDDDRTYPLPPGLGDFPLRHVDDHASTVPPAWLEHGGVMLPMYQAEAMWIHFGGNYPCAVKVSAGMIDAVTGQPWQAGLHRDPQDYLVVPDQPWLDGFCVRKGVIRQFVAMPLGAGYSAEEQLTGAAAHGGLQLVVIPMRAEAYKKSWRLYEERNADEMFSRMVVADRLDMGLAPGGQMRQEVFEDRFSLEDWDVSRANRCFVHISNSMIWRQLTGENPPHVPFTSKEYERAGLPWFEYYAGDTGVLDGSAKLAQLKSVSDMAKAKGDVALPENESVMPGQVVVLRKGLQAGEVRQPQE